MNSLGKEICKPNWIEHEIESQTLDIKAEYLRHVNCTQNFFHIYNHKGTKKTMRVYISNHYMSPQRTVARVKLNKDTSRNSETKRYSRSATITANSVIHKKNVIQKIYRIYVGDCCISPYGRSWIARSLKTNLPSLYFRSLRYTYTAVKRNFTPGATSFRKWEPPKRRLWKKVKNVNRICMDRWVFIVNHARTYIAIDLSLQTVSKRYSLVPIDINSFIVY